MNEKTNLTETTSQDPSDQFLSLDEYENQLVTDLNQILIGLILPEECINFVVTRLIANTYTSDYNKTVQLPSCDDACDYCLQLSKSKDVSVIFPFLNKIDVRFAFTEIFHGSVNKIINMQMTVEPVQKIRNYPSANMTFFGLTSKATPQLKSVEKLLIILLVTDILKISHCKIIVEKMEES